MVLHAIVLSSDLCYVAGVVVVGCCGFFCCWGLVGRVVCFLVTKKAKLPPLPFPIRIKDFFFLFKQEVSSVLSMAK